MKVLVFGGSGSGKSEYAEQLLQSCQNKYYIATMQPFGKEAEQRIKRHRQMRSQKGFKTIECYRRLCSLSENQLPKGSSVLLECMGNLAANEFFSPESRQADENIMQGVAFLEERCKNLIIVSNNIFSDGVCYQLETLEYMRLLGDINARLARRFEVIEVVCGIPIKLKEVKI